MGINFSISTLSRQLQINNKHTEQFESQNIFGTEQIVNVASFENFDFRKREIFKLFKTFKYYLDTKIS